MIHFIDNGAAQAELEQAIADCVAERTRGRVRDLRVVASHREVTVQGQAASFHVKQLAVAACNQVLGSQRSVELVLEIQVEPCHR